jgi:hypothetical protein
MERLKLRACPLIRVGVTSTRMRSAIVLSACVLLALAVISMASATVKRVSFTAVVSPNDYARLEVRVKPRARCTITVIYSTGESSAKGLRAKTGGVIIWRWKVGSQTKPGRWPVRVDCGKSGKLNLRLRVLR